MESINKIKTIFNCGRERGRMPGLIIENQEIVFFVGARINVVVLLSINQLFSFWAQQSLTFEH